MDHLHDVGVRCQALDTCGVVMNYETKKIRTIETTISSDAHVTTVQGNGAKTDNLMMTSMTLCANESSNTRGDIIGSTINALGVLTGLLAAALVVVTMGWIVSCVYWQRRDKRRCVVLCDIPFLFYQTER